MYHHAKKYFSVACTLLAVFLHAQDPMTFSYKPRWPQSSDSLHNALNFSGEYFAGSDAITNSFLNKLYTGGFIDSTAKADQENLLLPKNHIGAYSSYGFSYSWRNLGDSTRWEFTAGCRDRQVLFGMLTRDAFKTGFEGNRPFEGKTATFDGTNFSWLHWKQVQFEGKYFSRDNHSEAAFGVSIIGGQQFSELGITTGSMYTDNNGMYIDASANGSYISSDTARRKMMMLNGTGTCFNFRFSTIFGDSVSFFSHQLSFSIQDLGLIRWSGQSLVYRVDTTVHYTGADITDAVLNPGYLAAHNDVPNKDSLGGTPKKEGVVTFLPVGIRARYALITPFQWWGGVELRMWTSTGVSPQFNLFAGWHSADFRVNITGGASYGGFARLMIPLQIGWDPCKHFSISVGTLNLPAYIAPKITRGQGTYANVSFAF